MTPIACFFGKAEMVLCIKMFDIMSGRTTRCRRPRSMAPCQHSDPTKKSAPQGGRSLKNASLLCHVLMPYRPHIDSIGQAFKFGRNRFVPRQRRENFFCCAFSPVRKVVQRWCSETSIYRSSKSCCVTKRAHPTLGMIAALREQGPRSKTRRIPGRKWALSLAGSRVQY